MKRRQREYERRARQRRATHKARKAKARLEAKRREWKPTPRRVVPPITGVAAMVAAAALATKADLSERRP